MVVKHIQRKLQEKSEQHTQELRKLGLIAAKVELPRNVHVLPSAPQFLGMNTVLQNPETKDVDFIFYFDRLASILIERYSLFLCMAFCPTSLPRIIQGVGHDAIYRF